MLIIMVIIIFFGFEFNGILSEEISVGLVFLFLFFRLVSVCDNINSAMSIRGVRCSFRVHKTQSFEGWSICSQFQTHFVRSFVRHTCQSYGYVNGTESLCVQTKCEYSASGLFILFFASTALLRLCFSPIA